MAPVELVSLAGIKTQRHKRSCRAPHFLVLPAARVTADRIVTAFISLGSQRFEQPDQRQPFAPWLAFVLRQ